jgi:drug/metabolite transporter (DMT)-like permease
MAGSFVTWVVAFNAFYFALRSGKAGVVGPITGTDPLFTALFAVLIVGTALGGLTVTGLVIATVGVVLISRSTGDEPEAHAPVLEVAVDPVVQASALTVVTLAVVTAAGWGFGPVMIQLAETEAGGASTTMIILGEAFGVLLLGPFLLWRRSPVFTRKLGDGERRRVVWLVGVTATLNALFAVLYYVLIEHIGPVLTTVIVATSPIFTILGGVIFLKERFGRWLALGAAVTLVGVVIAILQPVFG